MMKFSASDYQAPRWLPGGHLQTIWPAQYMARPQVPYLREIWDTSDGDVVAVDLVCSHLPGSSPTLVHFHGLEGSSQSHYALALMQTCQNHNIRGVVIHYRGCGGIENRKPRAYFAADASELDWIFRRIKTRWPDSSISAMGVSLGANNLLYWAGTREEEASKWLDSIVAVCSPLDLVKSSQCFSSGFTRLYEWNFLRTLRSKAKRMNQQFPGLLSEEKIDSIRSLWDFDNCVTAPLHGFCNALDYLTRCSSKLYLGGIRVPTLLLNSRNDPFLKAECFPKSEELSDFIKAEFPNEGGHCGFPQGSFPGSLGYLPMRTLRFITCGE